MFIYISASTDCITDYYNAILMYPDTKLMKDFTLPYAAIKRNYFYQQQQTDIQNTIIYIQLKNQEKVQQ